MDSSPFLNLPREVRDRIYEWVFPSNFDIVTPIDGGKVMIEEYDSELVDQVDGVTRFVDHSNTPTNQLGKGFRICRRSGRPTWKVVQHSRSQAWDMLGLMLVNR